MTDYVLGFCFSYDKDLIVLIRKTRPEWQRGRLNAVGGKIEPNETPSNAITREFQEETSVLVSPTTWNHFATMQGIDWQKDPTGSIFAKVYCFAVANDRYYDLAQTCEEEKIEKWRVGDLLSFASKEMIPNLKVLIPLACCQEFEQPLILTWSETTEERQRKKIRGGA